MQIEELYAEYRGQMIDQRTIENLVHRDAHYDDPHIQEYWDEP